MVIGFQRGYSRNFANMISKSTVVYDALTYQNNILCLRDTSGLVLTFLLLCFYFRAFCAGLFPFVLCCHA